MTEQREDEAADLLARVHAGNLTEERLALAAYCGHEGARVTLGAAAPATPDVHQRDGLMRWAVGLRRWGREARVRAAIGAASVVQPLWERACPGRDEPASALAAARAWLACPCADHAAQAEAFGERAWDVADELEPSHGAIMAARSAAAAAGETRQRWSDEDDDDAGGDLFVALRTVQSAKGKGRRGAAVAIEAAARELIAWALSPRV